MKLINLNTTVKNFRKTRCKFVKFCKQMKVTKLVQIITLSAIDKRKRKIIFIGVIVIIVLVLTLAVSSHRSSGRTLSKSRAASVTQIQQQMINKLSQINIQLKALQKTNPEVTDESNQAILNLNQQLSVITNTINNLSSKNDVQKTQSMIHSTNQDISSRIENLQVILEKIKKQISPKHYLKASSLPFKIKDVIGVNGVLKVLLSDKQSNNYILRAKNEMYGDWKITYVGFSPKEVILINHKNQYAKVYISR